MRTEGVEEKVTRLAEEVAGGWGIEVVDVEFIPEHGRWVLRVYIDKPGGVTLDDCGDFSSELSTVLDVEDPVPERYALEVSSPGLDRPLKKPRDFERFIGRKAKIKTREPIEGRRNFKAVIRGVSDEGVVVTDSEERHWTIPIENISKARLEVEL